MALPHFNKKGRDVGVMWCSHCFKGTEHVEKWDVDGKTTHCKECGWRVSPMLD